MKTKWKAIRDAKFLVDCLPDKPIAWGIVGSATEKNYPHDIDICLIYSEKKDWMRDKKIWLQGWKIPFDLFFFIVPEKTEKEKKDFFISSLVWRGDTENFIPPKLKILREMIY